MRVERIGDAVLYLGDCLEVLPTLPKIDACITDPPYGIAHPCNYGTRKRGNLAGKRWEGGKPVWRTPSSHDYPAVHGDDTPFDPSPWLALNVPVCLWGGNYFADRLPPSSGWLVWDKERPDDLDQATCELAWTNYVKGVRRFRHLWNGMMKASEHGENYHPTQKPVALQVWVIGLRWTPQGTILDPFMGSGTTGVACAQLGRQFIGIEIDEGYFDIACERIERAYSQRDLFIEPQPKPEQEALL